VRALLAYARSYRLIQAWTDEGAVLCKRPRPLRVHDRVETAFTISGIRTQAHVGTPTAGRRRQLRGPQAAPGPQGPARNDPLLGARNRSADRGRGEGLPA
jgi:hypothetical protein